MTNKRSKGQFFTTNADYILAGFSEYIKGKNISDPFAGNKDLINWAIKNGAKTVKGFDIDTQYVDNTGLENSDTKFQFDRYGCMMELYEKNNILGQTKSPGCPGSY